MSAPDASGRLSGRRVLVERDVPMPARDGVALATDVYRPDDDLPHPVLVQRTPYGKSNAKIVGDLIFNPLEGVDRGYVVVVQDSRGRFRSEGEFEPIVDEAEDGYDVVEWAAAQPWSSGRVGIFGSSFGGIMALQAAIAAPPSLGAVLSYMTGADYHDGFTYSGGAFELGFNLRLARVLAGDALQRVDPDDRVTAGKQAGVDLADNPWDAARTLPLTEIPAFSSHPATSFWQEWLAHPAYDRYWAEIDVAAQADRIAAPLLHLSGWYDIFLPGHLALNEQLKRHPDERIAASHRFLIGPWDHESYMSVRLAAAGEADFGPRAAGGIALLPTIAFDWFDHWLRGEETALLEQPRCRYYVIGSGEWRTTSSWPPPGEQLSLYLHSAGHANTAAGDGRLDGGVPTDAEPADVFRYDPADPVPTVGGRSMHPEYGPGGIQDQSGVEDRDDVLVYSTEALATDWEIAGPVELVLHASTSAEDTDFTAKLVDVRPDGYCANIAEGILRARYRDDPREAVLVSPEEVGAYRIRLGDTAYLLPAGHRLRIEVSSSNFPRFSRNLNSPVQPELGAAEDIAIATQRVYHDAARPSHLLLTGRRS